MGLIELLIIVGAGLTPPEPARTTYCLDIRGQTAPLHYERLWMKRCPIPKEKPVAPETREGAEGPENGDEMSPVVPVDPAERQSRRELLTKHAER